MSATELSIADQELLSTVDVERLIAEISKEAHPATDSVKQTPLPTPEPEVQPFDFRGPSLPTPRELRSFQAQLEGVADLLTDRLSSYLHGDFTLCVTDVQTRTYAEFVKDIPPSCHLTLFKVEPLRGICILELNARLALAMSDRLMGGKGTPPSDSRELTQVEVALLEPAVQLVLSEWCAYWSKVQALTPMLLGHESTARFLRTSAPDATMILIVMEARLGDCVEMLHLAFPSATLEPLLLELRAKASLAVEQLLEPTPAVKPKWKHDFDEIPISIVAHWPGMKVRAGQLTTLAVGDVIPLPPEFASRIRLSLARAAKFSGRLGTSEDCWAVEITEVLKP